MRDALLGNNSGVSYNHCLVTHFMRGGDMFTSWAIWQTFWLTVRRLSHIQSLVDIMGVPVHFPLCVLRWHRQAHFHPAGSGESHKHLQELRQGSQECVTLQSWLCDCAEVCDWLCTHFTNFEWFMFVYNCIVMFAEITHVCFCNGVCVHNSEFVYCVIRYWVLCIVQEFVMIIVMY